MIVSDLCLFVLKSPSVSVANGIAFSPPPFIFADVIASFEQNQYPVSEGNGSVTVCITLNSTIERNITVTVSTLAITAQGESTIADHQLIPTCLRPVPHCSLDTTDFSPLSQDIVYTPTLQQLLQCVSIFVTSDLNLEENERFFAVLTSADPDVIIDTNIATVTILNDDGNTCTCRECSFDTISV